MKPQPVLKFAHAFTLIELLIVTAIISLLASLLLPALGKSKASGANHLFHDGNVQWIPWNRDRNLRANSFWAPQEYYFWRRTVEMP